MRLLLLAFLALSTWPLSAAPKDTPVDPDTGMKIAPGWEMVRSHCVICHSPQTFLRQRATEANWTSVLEWMQTKGGLWKLEPAIEKQIITYLATHYGLGDSQSYRRAPIPATLMPPNPYASAARIEAEQKRTQGLIPAKPAAGK